MVTYDEIRADINQGKIEQVYLFYGEERYFIEKIKEQLISQLTPLIGDEIVTYDLEQVSIEEVITDAETIPFLNEKKLIFAHNPTFLLAKQSRPSVTHRIQALESYLENPASYTILVFIAPYERLDNRKKITKLIKKHSIHFFSESIQEQNLSAWIDEIGKQYGITFTDEARLIIEAEHASNLAILQNEIEKIADYMGKGQEVTKDVVLQLLSQTEDMSVLQLVDAVLERNLYKAITIYKSLQKMNEEPISMIALLAYQFRMMLQVKLLSVQGLNEFAMRKEINAHPYVIKLAYQRSRHFSIERLEQIMMMFSETDIKMKQGLIEKDIAFELLLYNLIKN